MTDQHQTIAVLIPCFNEEKTIQNVVRDFKRELPQAVIYVFDNNSQDKTAELAGLAGAKVFKEKNQGKGCVVAAMLRKIDADYYVMVDGDDTYPVEYVHQLLTPLYNEETDMMVGERLSEYTSLAFRPMHVAGNHVICWLINKIFRSSLKDPMSGYRAFTREVAEAAPVLARGFDIETEFTLQLLNLGFLIKETTIPYRDRPQGSVSKLHTYQDGIKVVLKIFSILIAYKPLTFFGSLSLVLMAIGLVIGFFPVYEYILYQYIYSVPKAILAASIMVLAGLCLLSGLILNTINFRLFEIQTLSVKNQYRQRRFLSHD